MTVCAPNLALEHLSKDASPCIASRDQRRDVGRLARKMVRIPTRRCPTRCSPRRGALAGTRSFEGGSRCDCAWSGQEGEPSPVRDSFGSSARLLPRNNRDTTTGAFPPRAAPAERPRVALSRHISCTLAWTRACRLINTDGTGLRCGTAVLLLNSAWNMAP